jgi:Domain of unknown function (DUF4333)
MAKGFQAARLAGAAILVLSVTAAGCGGEKKVDTASIEKGIKDQVVAAGSSVTKVDCPSDVKSENGATFDCAVSFENSATGKVRVTQTSRNHFQYALVPGSLQIPGSVVEKQIQQQLTQQGASSPSVNCPDNIIVKVGTYVVCDVSGPKGSGSVKFTFSSASGTVDTSSVTTTG